MDALPETWDVLSPLLPLGGDWVRCMAWAVGGGDPDGCKIRLLGERAEYDAAWCICRKHTDVVRLSRLDFGREVVRRVRPDRIVEVRRARSTL